MTSPQLLQELFRESYTLTKQQIDGVSHQQSIFQPPFEGNCINWIVGHIVVARCNFMMMLDVPSIWDWDQCRRFIPGSDPVTSSAKAVAFDTLTADLNRTQVQLQETLTKTSTKKLQQINNDKAIGVHLALYCNHETYHAGQLAILRHLL